MTDISREELQLLIEKMERDKQAMLEKMTPEEREAAEQRAKRAIEEDNARMQKLIDDAAAVSAGVTPKATAAPKFCENCGAPAEGGKFCSFCGSPLTHAVKN